MNRRDQIQYNGQLYRRNPPNQICELIGRDIPTGETNIGKTENYQWDYTQKLGQGASCIVYKGTISRTGALIAAKVFNTVGIRYLTVKGPREFDILRNIQHKNIVSLIEIENDIDTHQPIVIMELCDFSLRDMLDMPEHTLGLSEENVLTVIRDVTNGVQYLRNKNIAHRDIKPGNIMCSKKKDDGSLIFKLADFGASKILKENQPFDSISGTVEYLHPNLYERAIAIDTRDLSTIITANSDLWSIGATFYHIITGQLPFRVYGDRDNKKVFHHMISSKKFGVISAYQDGESYGSPIVYCETLPEHCHISKGLRKHLTTMLAHLMESKPDKAWCYKQFFDYIKKLLNMTGVHVFMPSTSSLFKVYVSKDDLYSVFSNEIESLTGIINMNQKYFFEYDELFPVIDKPFLKYIDTSIDKPIILINNEYVYNSNIKFETYPEPKLILSSKTDFKNDYKFIKYNLSVLYYIRGLLEEIIEKQKLYTVFSTTIYKLFKKFMNRLSMRIGKIGEHINDIPYLLKIANADNIHIKQNSHDNNDKISLILRHLRLYIQTIETKTTDFYNNKLTYKKIADYVMNHTPSEVVPKTQLEKWKDIVMDSQCSYSCIKQFNVLLQQMVDIFSEYKKDKESNHVTPINELRHMNNKEKCIEITTMAMSLLSEHCNKNLQQMNTNNVKWWNDNLKCHIDNIIQFENDIEHLKAKFNYIKKEIHTTNANINTCRLEYFKTIHRLESEKQVQQKPKQIITYVPIPQPKMSSVSTNTELVCSSSVATNTELVCSSSVATNTELEQMNSVVKTSSDTLEPIIEIDDDTLESITAIGGSESSDTVNELMHIIENIRGIVSDFKTTGGIMNMNQTQLEYFDDSIINGMDVVNSFKQQHVQIKSTSRQRQQEHEQRPRRQEHEQRPRRQELEPRPLSRQLTWKHSPIPKLILPQFPQIPKLEFPQFPSLSQLSSLQSHRPPHAE